ncbi:NAD(P)-binding protein [Viridothelium virens]|uniref:NAD(P)-binding protein n=1 Tax=Viridothelium virens TaxID=1048519 RepID=A0A6A6GUI1_VIRVR|nr:NAD(P)-binding protein [Viridothelium virens]
MKTVAVIGATGSQGGGVARQLQKSGEWQVRGITRNVESKSAQNLKTEGMEVVAADLDDHESLMKAFQGVHAIYAVTNFWEHIFTKGADGAGQHEVKQASNISAAAAHIPTLEHYVFSTLQPASVISKGKAPVPHMDYKATVDDYIKKELPELAKKTTFLCIAFYGANLAGIPFMKPLELPMSGGKYIWAQPTPSTALLPLTGNGSHNVGVFVRAIISHPEKTRGKYMNVKTEVLTFQQILNIWSEVSGKEAVYAELGVEEYEKLWGPAGTEMAMQYKFGQVAKGDWEVLMREKGVLVQPEEVGIRKGDLLDLRQTLEGMKDSLV